MSVDAEMAVLAAMMNFRDAFYQVSDKLDPEHFSDHRCRCVYEAMHDLIISDNKPVDMVTVANKLDESGKLFKIGGRAFLAELTTYVATTSNVKHHANILIERRQREDLQQLAKNLIASATESSATVESTVSDTMDALLEIQAGRQYEGERSVGELIPELSKRIEGYRSQSREVTGIPTNYADLDKNLVLRTGDLLTIAADTRMGKTALALNILTNMAKLNYPGLFLSLEMKADELMDRLICSEAEVDSLAFIKGQLSDFGYRKTIEAQEAVAGLPLYIDDNPSARLADIYTRTARAIHQRGVEVVVIDYLSLIDMPRDSNANERVAQTTRALKNMARTLDVVVILLAQTNKQGEGYPTLRDVAGSKSIINDSDAVFFIYRPEVYDLEWISLTDHDGNKKSYRTAGLALLPIRKLRKGPTTTVWMTYRGYCTKFADYFPESSYGSAHPQGRGNDSGDIGKAEQMDLGR